LSPKRAGLNASVHFQRAAAAAPTYPLDHEIRRNAASSNQYNYPKPSKLPPCCPPLALFLFRRCSRMNLPRFQRRHVDVSAIDTTASAPPQSIDAERRIPPQIAVPIVTTPLQIAVPIVTT
jgi:hypothetical protein